MLKCLLPEEKHGAPDVEQASHEHALRPPELDDLALWDLDGGGVLTSHQSCPIVINVRLMQDDTPGRRIILKAV